MAAGHFARALGGGLVTGLEVWLTHRTFRAVESMIARLPLADKALGTLTELLRSYQQHEQARETLRLQRLELENRALAQFAQALESSTRTLDALHAQAIEREQSVLDLLRRLSEAQHIPRRPRRKPAPA